MRGQLHVSHFWMDCPKSYGATRQIVQVVWISGTRSRQFSVAKTGVI